MEFIFVNLLSKNQQSMASTHVNTKRLNKDLWTNISRLKLLDRIDASPRFVLEKSPFNDFNEEEIDEGTYVEKEEYLIIGRIFPQSTWYKNGLIKIEMIVTSNYPAEPPRVRFLTPVYHPNIEPDGTFCHQLISHKSRWTRGTTLVDVIKAVVKHLDEPDPDYAARFDIGEEFVKNRSEFDRKAKLSAEPYVVQEIVADAEPNVSNDSTSSLPIVELGTTISEQMETNSFPEDVQMDLDVPNETNQNDNLIVNTDESPVETLKSEVVNEQNQSFLNSLTTNCTIS